MRTMETLELGLTAQELQALANGETLQAPLEDDQRLLLYAVATGQPEDTDGTADTPESPDEIAEGAEVEQ